MARPFIPNDNSENQQEKKTLESKSSDKEANFPQERNKNSSQWDEKSSFDQIDAPIIKCKSDPKDITCDAINITNESSEKEKEEMYKEIKINKVIFSSNRNITVEDIQIVSTYIGGDWKKLLKKLPGFTFENLHFVQAFINSNIDAVDSSNVTNGTETVLSLWKDLTPEFSTIGNLSTALFNIGYPDVVTYLTS